MINDFVQQIISMDNKAEDTAMKTAEEAEKIRNQTLEQIKTAEAKVLTEAKEQGKKNYEQAIAKAEEEKKHIIAEADKACAEERARFNAVRTQTARRVLETLLSKQG